MKKPEVAFRSSVDSPKSVDWRGIETNASSNVVSVSENRQKGPLKIVSALLITVIKRKWRVS